jgi:hypothetical protein
MCGLHRRIDLGPPVGGREEERLELRRRDVDAARQEVTEPPAVTLRVARGRVLEGADRCFPEEEGRHRTHPLHGHRLACRGLLEPGLEPRAGFLEALVDGQVAQPRKGGQGRRRREGVPRQRARLVDGARRGELVHDVGPPPERGQGKPAARDLAEHGQVGGDAVALLGAAARDPEAGDHLVEDEERAGGVAERAQPLEEPRLRRDDAHVPGDGLDDDRRQVLGMALDGRAHVLDVVVAADERVRGGAGRHAGRGGDAEGRHAGPRGGEERVGVAVVAAGELEDPVAAGRAAREAQRAHRRLGPRRDEANLLDRGHGVDELLRERHLALGRRAEGRPRRSRLLHGLDDLGIGVPEDERPPGHHPVEIAVALRVPDVGALAASSEERLAGAHGPPGPDRGVDAAGDDPVGAPIEPALGQSHSASSRAQ